MERAKLAKLRILAVGGEGHAARVLRTVLSVIGIHNLVMIEDARRAIELLCAEHFDALYYDEGVETVGDLAFALAVRQAPGILSPLMPVFAVYGGVRRRQVEQSRDLGVTDVLTCPVSARTVLRKLRAALSSPRPFIAAPGFFGPDRRVEARAPRGGRERRLRVPKKVKVAIVDNSAT